MLNLARDIIGSQPILTLFLAIGLGYLVGQISIAGFSLGVGAVLFVGLAIGAIAPKASITGPISLIGLIMFLYGIGILYGKEFFEGMTGAAGRRCGRSTVSCQGLRSTSVKARRSCDGWPGNGRGRGLTGRRRQWRRPR